MGTSEARQTCLQWPDVTATEKVLDTRRLGKRLVEALQIFPA